MRINNLLLLTCIASNIICLEVIPERFYITYFDPNYIKWMTGKVQRYTRRGKYYFHLEGHVLRTWNNNVSIHLVFNEYLHNEYRRSFIEMKAKFCNILNGEFRYVGPMLARAGIACPLTPGEFHYRNLSASTSDFPNVFPFEKGMVEFFVSLTDSGKLISSGQIMLIFKQKA